MTDQQGGPKGLLANATVAMPKDTNPNGDIFGGWLMSQMDLAGGIAAGRRAHGRTVTIAVQEMTFLRPVPVGNLVSCFTEILKVGRTSVTVKIEAWAQTHDDVDDPVKVTEGVFTYVAIDDAGKPREVPPE
jgi:acyl-CoA thioesterase YciA